MSTGCRRTRIRSPAGLRLVAALAAVSASVVVTGEPKAVAAPDLSGMTVVLDPGHNGANDASISRQVPNGRGGTKDCTTTGTATGNGYPEHSFNWDVASRVRDALDRLGARTAMSRESDTAVGPCVDERAALANSAMPDAIVSIHADGGPPSGHGFHVNYSSPPLNEAQAGAARQLAAAMHDALVGAGLRESDYIGSQGLYGRADLAGLNLARYPAVLVELGNMKNPADAALMESEEGRARYAVALTEGIAAYLSAVAAALAHGLRRRTPAPGVPGQKLSPENMIRPGSYRCRTALSRDRFEAKYRAAGWFASR